MPRSFILFSSLLLALLIFRGLAEAEVSHRRTNTVFSNDIRFDEEPVAAGSGSGKLPFSDDEDFGDLSGSGSGSGQGDTDFVPEGQTTLKVTIPHIESTKPTTKAPLSACEHMRQTNLMMGRKSIPNCEDGVYAPLQCAASPGEADCWCSDKFGKRIPGTVMEPPNIPECDSGKNLSPCLYQLVTAMRQNLLGSPKPQCTSEGHFFPVQCTGAACYCVDKITGEPDRSTIVHRPATPRCFDDVEEEKPKHEDHIPLPINPDDSSEEETDDSIKMEPDDKEKTDLVIPGSENIDSDESYNIDNDPKSADNDIDDELVQTEKDNSDENKIDQGVDDNIRPDRYRNKETKLKATSPILAQPGLLAGIIGGSVVLALCLVLLVMFIIYRMRKKDEGSYPLDEPRKPPKYPYMRAPEREFYA